MKPNIYIYMSYILLAVGILFLLSACKSTELKELENSASKIQLTKGHEVSRSSQDKAVVLGKQQYAQLNINYEPLNNNYTKREVYDEIVAILEENNWKRDDANVVPDFYSASLTQGYSKLLVSVGMDAVNNQVRVEFVNRNP